MTSKTPHKHTVPHLSTGSVLKDLGFSPSEALEIKVKAEIYRDLLQYIRDRDIPQKELGPLLGLHQPDVSNLLNGKVARFSVGKLIKLAGKLDLGAQIKLIRPKLASRGSGKLPSVSSSASRHACERLTSSL